MTCFITDHVHIFAFAVVSLDKRERHECVPADLEEFDSDAACI